MRYFIIRNVYSPIEFGGPHESYHIVKANDWVEATDIIWKHRIFDGDSRPVRSELYGEGTKEEFKAVFFKGTQIYAVDSKGNLKIEYL